MKLRRQLLGLFYLSAVAAVLIGAAAVYRILTPAVSDFENNAARRELARVESAFLQTFTTLYARTRDWAEMDRVAALVAGSSDIVPMVPGAAPDNLRLDAVITFDGQGQPVWWRGEVAGAQAQLTSLYQAFTERACYPLWGVMQLGDAVHIFAMHPVTDCGAAVFAVRLDDQLAYELSGLTGLDVVLRDAGGIDNRQVAVDAADSDFLRASFPVVDYLQQPLLRGEVRLPREVYQRGEPLMLALIGAVLAVALITATLLYVFVQRRVFGRLALLHQAVRQVARGEDLGTRISVRGNDELSDLASDFNAMLEHINDAQDSLATASERAEAANRAKSLFLANMSHEIRTPMTAMLGYAELLEHTSLSEEERRRYLAIIQQNGDALMALISDVLDLSRIEAGQVKVEQQPCNLPTLMKDVLNSQILRARHKGITLSLNYDGEVPDLICSDPFRLRQILLNLIGNAIKFTERGGVTVSVSCSRGDPVALAISVSDTGIGIAEKDLPLVFEPFSQVDESHTRRFGGSGLGLAIARQLSRSLKGDISVSSRQQQGSIFTLTVDVPLAAEATWVQPAEALAVEQKSIRLPAIRSSGRVLVVDDNQVNRLLVVRVLSHAGFDVEEAADGSEALACCEPEQEYDLIVLDMQMPVMDGFEAARVLRGRGYRGAILALTANVMAEDRRRCLEAGCDEFLGKPVRGRHLLDACVRLMSRSPISTRRA